MSIENGSSDEQIDNIQQQSVSSDPCEEVQEQPSRVNNDPAEQPTEQDTSTVVVPPFLAPIKNVESPLRYVNREISVINRTLFVDSTWDSQNSRFSSVHLPTPQNTFKDPLRALYGHHWKFSRYRFAVSATQDTLLRVDFASSNIDWDAAYQNGKDTYTIENEQFSSTTRYWSAKVTMKKKFNTRGERDGFWNLTDVYYQNFEIPRQRRGSGADRQWFYPYLRDNVFSAPQPFHGSEMNNIEIPSLTHASVKAHVNYYEEKPHVPETSMPSIYRTYYKTIHNYHENCDFDDKVQKFSSDSVSVMKQANESIKHAFNHYVEITIPTQQGSKICTLLDEFQMDKYFLELVSSNYMIERPYVQTQEEAYGTETNQYEASINDRYSTTATNYTSPDPFYKLINTIKDRDLSFFEGLNHVTYPLKYEFWRNPEALRFTDTIRSQILMNRIEDQILDKINIRSLSEIWSGQKAYSEVVGYKISKHEVVDGVVDPVPIQKFFIMDSDKVLTIDFIDTQINPGKTYAYRIHSLNLVIGSKYTYVPITEQWQRFNFPNRYEVRKSFNAVVRPDIKIIEAPFFEKILTVIEKPPLAPLVSFIPDQGVDNKMKILLQSSFGELEQRPIKIFDADQEVIDQMVQSQELREDGTLEYQTDSLPESFQVIRLSHPPESYQDFANPDYVRNINMDGQSTVFEDVNFEPNKDYYYCFRSYDKIGVSNPTQVYKVNLRSYSNGIFSQVKQYEMRPAFDRQRPIIFHRAFKISPSFSQTALTFGPEVDIESRSFAESAPGLWDFDVGDSQGLDSIWGKKYKFRIISKKTGKKIDLNVEFTKSRSSRMPFDATQQDGEPNPCAATELDLQLGNDGGMAVSDPDDPPPPPTLETETPDAGDPYEPDGGGYAQAQEVLQKEQIGERFGERTGMGNEAPAIFGSQEGKEVGDKVSEKLDEKLGKSDDDKDDGLSLTVTDPKTGDPIGGPVGDDVIIDKEEREMIDTIETEAGIAGSPDDDRANANEDDQANTDDNNTGDYSYAGGLVSGEGIVEYSNAAGGGGIQTANAEVETIDGIATNGNIAFEASADVQSNADAAAARQGRR